MEASLDAGLLGLFILAAYLVPLGGLVHDWLSHRFNRPADPPAVDDRTDEDE